MVIDDSTDILEAIQLILESAGYSSKAIAKGDQAYDTIKKYKPDLIILDILLSGNDGRNICKKLKSDKSYCNIPVIMISAHPAAKSSLDECGAEGFIAKPFSMETLLAEVKKFVG